MNDQSHVILEHITHCIQVCIVLCVCACVCVVYVRTYLVCLLLHLTHFPHLIHLPVIVTDDLTSQLASFFNLTTQLATNGKWFNQLQPVAVGCDNIFSAGGQVLDVVCL